MERRKFGKTGFEVSVLGFGGSEIGYQGVAAPVAEKLLNAALDAGVNVLDTAACYVDSEELIGRAVSHRRAEYVLMTKCGHGDGLGGAEFSPALIANSIERSLKRLRTDHLDLVQLHSCSAAVLRKGDAIEALARARNAGKIRCIGYSGDGEEAMYAVQSGAFDTLQISVSIADQEALEEIIPAAMERGMGVIAKRPIANAAWRKGEIPMEFYSRPYRERLRELEYDFFKRELKESVAIALRFTLSIPGVHTAIVGTTNPARIADNAAAAAAGPLPKAEYEAIRARWRKVAKPSWVGQR
jgi:aryl-alcohol dehydrogenase-like predicted oxidoreductase